MPDLLDKVFDEKETLPAAGYEPEFETTVEQLNSIAGAESQIAPDMLDRIFDEPEESAFQLPDDPNEQDRLLKEFLDIAGRAEVPVTDVERNPEVFKDIDRKQTNAEKAIRMSVGSLLSTLPTTVGMPLSAMALTMKKSDLAQGFMKAVSNVYKEKQAQRAREHWKRNPYVAAGMGGFSPYITKETAPYVPLHLGRTLYEIPKGVARFLERDVGGTFGGTVYNWIGQLIESGGMAIDWVSKFGYKNKDRIYNPYAEAIIATGQNIAKWGKDSREAWAYQAITGWEALDQELYKTDPISYGAGRLSEGVASSALSVLAMFLSGGAAAPELLNKGVQINRGLAILSAMSAAGGFEHAQNQGENFAWSTLHGLADGTIEYVMETSFLEGVKPGKGIIGTGLKEAGEEFVTGMLQNTRAGILENSNKGMSPYQAAKNAIISALKQSPWEVAAGFIGGAGMASGASLVELVERANSRPIEGEAEEKPEIGAEVTEKSGWDMTPEEIQAIKDPEDRRIRAIEYLDDTSEQWRRFEDELMRMEETDPLQHKPETKAVMQQLEKMIDNFLKAPTEEVEAPPTEKVPEEPEKPGEVVKRHAVEILPRKQELLKKIDEAIKNAPETPKVIEGENETVNFEIDGGANIINDKKTLRNFRDKVSKLPETEQWPRKPKRGVSKKKPLAAKKEKIGELMKAPEGWFTDGRVLVKGEPPAKTRRIEGYKEKPELEIDKIINAPTEPAEFVHYAIEDPETGKGISERPIPHIEAEGRGPVAVFKSGDMFYMYDQDLFNVIRNRYPDARYGVKADNGQLVAYMEDEPVAAMMPINPNETAEPPGMTEPPVSLKETPETEPLVKVPPETPEPMVGSLVKIVDDPSTAHLKDAASKQGKIIDIQVVRGKARAWAVRIGGEEYIVDDPKDMEIQPAERKNRFTENTMAEKEAYLKALYEHPADWIEDEERLRIYEEFKQSLTDVEREEFKAVLGVLDKQIAHRVKRFTKPSAEGETPVMKQWRTFKEKYPDTILMVRMGDFYEMFGEDAEVASKVLGLTKTKRGNMALAGVPYHVVDTYLKKLIQAGHRVALVDQVESGKKGKTKRDVVRIVTPKEGQGFMPEHERSEPGVLIVESGIGNIYIPEAELTGEYGKDLEKIFAYGNFQSDVEQPDLKRSLSVGDTIKYRGHTLMVMQQGWRDITGLSDDAIKAIQTSENAIGLDASWRQAEERLRKENEVEGIEETLESEAPEKPIAEINSMKRLRDDLQQRQDEAVQDAVDYFYEKWPSVAERYNRAELIGQGAGFIESFLRELSQQIEQEVQNIEPTSQIARNAVKIISEIDQYITPLSEATRQIAGLDSQIEAKTFGLEAKRVEEASRKPETENIKNVVVDQFREWPQQVKRVGKDYWIEVMAAAKKLATPYRYKALRKTLLGAFRFKKRPVPEAIGIEVQDVTDALTATHELSHDIDWLINNKSFPSNIKGRFPDTKAGEMTLRKELKACSQILRPDLWEKPKAYIKSHTELMADFISLYILDPELTRQLAPNLTTAFETKLANNPELFETISRLQESRYTGPEEPAIAEHIRKDFPLPKEFTPLQLNIDMIDNDYVKAAENLGLTAARHYKMLLHRAETEAQRIDKLVSNKDRQTDLVVIAENAEKNPWTGKTQQEIIDEGLTPNEEKAINLFRAYQEQARQTVNKYLRGADIAEYIRFIEDYFIHSYHTPMTEKYKTAIARWAKRSPQAKKRILPDLNTAVELGLRPRTKTLSDGLRLWAGINYRVMTNKAFLRILPKINNDDGISILQKPQDYPDWPTVDYAPIRQTYSVPLGDRGVLLFQGRVAVDPRVKPFIDAMFGRRVFSTPVRVIEGLNAVWKSFELTLFSFFHHAEEFFSTIGALGPHALPVVGGYYGKTAKSFGKTRRLGFLPARVGALDAGKQLENVPEFMEDYIAHGGQTGYISTEGINLMERMLKSVEDYFKVITQTKPGVGQLAWAGYVPAKGARATYSWFQHLLWDNVERAKLVSYYQIVSDGAIKSDLPIKEVKDIAVKYVNDNYGGQEWLNTIFRNPKTRQFWTQLMMSLDWTWSQIKTARWPFMYGGKTEIEQARRELMRKIGRHHWFWYTSAIAGFTIAGSFVFTGKGPWDNEKDHKFEIDWTNIWRKLPWNRDWKKKGDYNRRYISLGKAGRELIRWGTSPLRAFGYKLSPVARSIFEQSTGYNMGSNWPEPWAREELEGYQELYARFKHLMENFKPFSLSGNNAFLAFPSKKGMTEWKATRALEDIYKARAKIATGGIAGKIAELDRALKKDEKKIRADIIEACRLNKVDFEKAERMALAATRSKYYRLFWDAAKEQNIDKCNRYASALLELGISGRGFMQSLRYRAAELPREAKIGGVKALRQAVVEKSKQESIKD